MGKQQTIPPPPSGKAIVMPSNQMPGKGIIPPPPTGKAVIAKQTHFSEEPNPDVKRLVVATETDDFINRFAQAKDNIDLSMWQGMKAKFGEQGSESVWNDFLDNRIKVNAQDVVDGHNKIKWTKEDQTPFKGLSDIIDRPEHFFTNQLPELLGGSVGTMLEPILLSAGTAAVVGTVGGPIGTLTGLGTGFVAGLAAGTVGLFSGRFMESMAEAGDAYKQAVEILKNKNPTMPQSVVHQEALKVLDDTFNKNMALGLMDIPEMALAFIPAGRMLGKFGSIGRKVGKVATNRPYASNVLARNAGTIVNTGKALTVAGLEGAEEGIQYYISESALNQVRPNKDQVDTSLAGMWRNDEFQASVQSGFLLGGLLGGAGAVAGQVFKSKEKLSSISPEDQIAEQKKLKEEIIFKAAKNGQQSWAMAAVEDQAELFYSDDSIRDPEQMAKSAKDSAKKAVKDMESKFQIYDSVSSNRKIKDEESLKVAFLNTVRIHDAQEKVKNLELSPSLNKSAIEDLTFEVARMEKENELIGKGKSVIANKDQFDAIQVKPVIEVKTEAAKNETVPEPKKFKASAKGEPTAAAEPKPAVEAKPETVKESVVEKTIEEKPVKLPKFKSTFTEEEISGPDIITDLPYKAGDEVIVNNPKISKMFSDIKFESASGQRVRVSGIKSGNKSRSEFTLSPTQISIPGKKEEKKVITKEEQEEIDYKSASDVPNLIKEIKNLSYLGLPSGEVTTKIKKNFPKLSYNEVRRVVHSVRSKEGIPSTKNKKEFAEWQEKVKPKPKKEVTESKESTEKEPSEFPKKFKAKDSNYSEEELKTISDLENLKIKIKPGELNDISRVISAPVWNGAVEIMIAGYKGHRKMNRAVREAIEYIRSTDWYKGLTKKEKRAADRDLQKTLNEQVQEKITNKIKEQTTDEFGATQDDQLENIFNESFEEEKEAGVFYDDNDSRVLRHIKTSRRLYENIPGVRNRDSFESLYLASKDESFDEGNLREEIEKIRSKNPLLADRLDELTENDLIQLFNNFKNIERVPFFHHINISGEKYSTSLSNVSQEAVSNIIDSVKQKVEDKKSAEIAIKKYIADRTKIFKKYSTPKKVAAYNNIHGNPEIKAEVFDNEMQFLKDLTGQDWNEWLNVKQLPKNSGFKTYKDYYVNTASYKTKDKTYNLGFGAAYRFLISENYSELLTKLTGKSKQYKSNIEQLADVIARTQPDKLGNYFDNVKNNRKSGYVLKSHLIDSALSVHTASTAGYLSDNDFVNYWKEKGKPAGVVLYDGINNKNTGKKEEVGSLSERDLQTAIITTFVDPGVLAEPGEYLLPVEQLSDKKQVVYTRVKKYSLAEAKKKINELRNNASEIPSDKEINNEVQTINDFIQINHKRLGIKEEDSSKTAEEFVYNYALNKHYTDLYFQGKPENYVKKGKFSYVDQVKRAGSMHSSGEVPNLKTEGGIGETARHIVLSNVMNDLEIKDSNGKVIHEWKGNDAADIADGQTYHTEEWDQKVQKSTGGMYHTILKAIYSSITKNGKRVLIKSNSTMLTAEYVKDKPVLKALLDLMNKEKADYVTVKSGVKHDVDNSMTEFDWKAGKVSGQTKVITRSNRNWRIQQDFTQNERLDWKRLTKQMLRHFMDFENGPKMQKLFNTAIENETVKLQEEIKDFSSAELRDFLIKNIEDSESNYHVRQLLKNSPNLDHPHLRSIAPAMFASVVTKKMLDIKGNGGIYIESSSVGTDLKGPRIENGKYLPGEVLVPEQSGLSIGDHIFITRVPSSNHHSTSYSVVKGFLPHKMGNVVVVDPISQKIAGADFDGDARHIWAPFKNKKGEIIQYKEGTTNTRSIINEAFRLAAEEYTNPENFNRIISPIDLETVKEDLKSSDFKDEIGNKNLLSSMMKMYRNNKDGKVVVGIVATSGKLFSFFRGHKAILAKPISFPMIENGKMKGSIELSEVKVDDKTKETIANNINQAVDAAKEQNLEPMGMNEAGASLYNMLEQLGLEQKHAINYFAHPLMRDYMKRMRDAKSVGSEIREFDVIDDMAEEIMPNSTVAIEDKAVFPEYPKDVELTQEDIEAKDQLSKLKFLQKLKYLLYVSGDYFTFKSVIDLSENNPKTFSEFYNKQSDFREVEAGDTRFILENVAESPYVDIARRSLQWSEDFFKKSTIFGTQKAIKIINEFETMFTTGKHKKPLSKTQVEKLSEAIHGVVLGEILGNRNKQEVLDESSKMFKEFTEENKFISILEVDEQGKLGLKKDLRRQDMDVAEIEEIKGDFELLPELFQQVLLYNTYYQHGFSNSKKFGGYSMFISDDQHQSLSEAIDSLKHSWNNASEEEVVVAVKSIISQNPELVPDANFVDHGDKMYLKKVSKLNYPRFVKRRSENGYKIFRRLKGTPNYYKEDSAHNFTVKVTNDVKTYGYDTKYQTGENINEPLASFDPELREYVESELKRIYPDVNVKFIDNHKYMGMDVLGMAAGNTISIDRTKAVQSTYFHEHAHLYWDALPENDSAKKSLIKMFGTEEEAIQAIGEAGVGIAKVKMSSALKGLLTSFWRKVKAIFGVASKEDAAAKMAERIWDREDSVTFDELSDDIIKFQLSDGVLKEQNEKLKRLTDHFSGDLASITYKDVDKITGKFDLSQINEEALEEAGIELPEGRKMEEFENNPELFFSILSGNTSDTELISKAEYSKRVMDQSYLNLKGDEKNRFESLYLTYKNDFDKKKKLWNKFPSLKSIEEADPVDLRDTFNELEGMDQQARGVLYNVVLDKIFSHRMSRYIREENSDGFSDYKLASLALHDMIFEQKSDFKNPLSKILTSAKDIGEKQKMLQLHYQKIATHQAEAQLEFSSIEAEMQDIVAQVKKEGGDLKNTVSAKTTQGGEKLMAFKKIGTTAYKSLKESERRYIDFVIKTRKIYKDSDSRAGLLPSIDQDFVSIMRKYGLLTAVKVSVFGSNANDKIIIKDQFGQTVTLKTAKAAVELDKKNGVLANVQAIRLLNQYENQAKEYRKKGYDAKGNIITEGKEGSIPMGYGFEFNEYSSNNVEAIMKEYVHKLVFKNKMEKYLPMAAFFKKYYSDGSTKYAREWINSFNDNVLFGKNPESRLGGFEKPVKFLLQWTAWRYLALNPIGMVFNLSAGVTQSSRELGWKVMLTSLKRMKNFKKAYGIMKHHKVVNTTIDTDLSESTKNMRRFQRAMFSTVEVAETINQAYTYIGLMTPEEWDSYDDKGNLKKDSEGINNTRHVYLMEQSARVNGAYSTILRRPISYTTEGRLIMQFKGWLPDVFLAHWQKYRVDSYGKEQRGIINSLIDPKVWSLMQKGLTDKKAWDALSPVDRQNIGKASRELIMAAMLLLLISSIDDDDENKEATQGLKRILGDITFVFDLDNWIYLFDSPVPVASTIKDLIGAISDVITLREYKRKKGDNDAGDLTAPDKFMNMAPAHRTVDILF